MIELLAAVTAFAAVFILVLGLVGSQESARARLESLWAQPAQQEEDVARMSLTQRLVSPMMGTLVGQLRRAMPTAMLEGLQQRLVVAGEPMTLNGFLTFQLLTTGAFFFLPVLLIVGGMLKLSLVMVLVVAGSGILGFALPHLWLNQRSGQRRNQIIKSLPDSFDLITTCVEAGLGLDAALARLAERVEGPFADELRRTLREISLGRARSDSMKELGERTGVPDLITFVNSIIQAEQMGSSVGTVLRVQADQLRVRRRQRAEEQAYRAPIKMIFPLILCIFPTLFIVILGPAVITIMRDFPS